MINTLVIIELKKVFLRKRSYIGFVAIMGIITLVQVAMFVEGNNMLNMFTQNLANSFILEGNLFNGYFVTLMLLNSLWVLMPFLVSFVAADLVSGEAHSGTLRYALIQPVSRSQLAIAKWITACIYTLLLVLFLMSLSLTLGLLFFGKGDLLIINKGISIIDAEEVFWRFIAAFTYASLAMLVVTSLSFLFSVLTDNSIGPIIGTMAIVIGFTIISNLNIEVFAVIRKFLFTTYMSSWALFFDFEIKWNEIIQSVVVCLTHIIIFTGSAIFIFKRKDILS